MSKYEDIISAARKLFTKYGYKKVSMDEIAKEANVTKKTIYSYFKDKQELFSYFLNEELMNLKVKIDKNIDSNESYLEKITENLNLILSLSNESELLKTLIKERGELANNKENFFKIYEDKIIEYLEEKLNEDIKNNNIKLCDTHLTAFIIYKVIFSITFEYNTEINTKMVLKEFENILMNGLLERREK